MLSDLASHLGAEEPQPIDTNLKAGSEHYVINDSRSTVVKLKLYPAIVRGRTTHCSSQS